MLFGLTPAIRQQVLTLLLLALAGISSQPPLAWTYQTGNYSWAAVVSRDGEYVLAGSDDMHSYFFRTDSGEAPSWVHASSGYVRYVALSEDGSFAATGDTGGDILFFRLQQGGSPVWSYRSDSPISALAMSQKGDYLVAGDRQGRLYGFNTESSTPLIWQTTVFGGILAISISDSLNLVATGAQGGLYFFGQIPSLSKYAWSFQNFTTFPHVVMAGEGEYIVAGGSDGGIYVISLSGQLSAQKHVAGGVSAFSVSDDRRFVAAGSTSGTVALYALTPELQEIEAIETSKPITAVAVSAGAERISFASLNGTIGMYQHSLARRMWAFSVGAIVHCLSMSRDGRVMVAASDTGSVYLFNENGSAQTDSTSIITSVILVCVASVVIGVIALRRVRRRPAIVTARSGHLVLSTHERIVDG